MVLTTPTSSRALCVELSGLTSSIPIWVMGRPAAITSSLFSSGKLGQIHFCSGTALCCAASDKRHGNINSHLRTISFEPTMLTPHASGRSPRGGSLPCSLPPALPLSLSPSVLGPACPVYGVIRIDFQHPNLNDGSSSGSSSREGSEKTLQVGFQVELGKDYVVLLQQQLCCKR